MIDKTRPGKCRRLETGAEGDGGTSLSRETEQDDNWSC